MGAFDSFVELGDRLRDSINGLFDLVLEDLPNSLSRGERWSRQNSSEETVTRDLFWRPVSGELKKQQDVSTPTLFGLSGSSFDPWNETGNLQWNVNDELPSKWKSDEHSSATTEEQRILAILSENPDLLGRVIQREKSRGNPLFE